MICEVQGGETEHLSHFKALQESANTDTDSQVSYYEEQNSFAGTHTHTHVQEYTCIHVHAHTVINVRKPIM